MIIETVSSVFDSEEIDVTKLEIRKEEFMSVANGPTFLVKGIGVHFDLNFDRTPLSQVYAWELLQLLEDDDFISFNDSEVFAVKDIRESVKPLIVLGEYEPSQLLRWGSDTLYSKIEELLEGKYDVTDATLKFKGAADKDGYITIEATLDEFSAVAES